MPNQETVDKFFAAVNDSYDALLDAVRSANDRGYRISRKLIDETERGQREAIELTRRLATSPRDVAGFYSSSIRAVTDAQGRVLDLTRQLIDEVGDGQREGRDTIRRVIGANREAGQAAIEATRDTVSRAGSAVENVRGSVRRRTSTNSKTREASETKSS
ncbi:MAG: hypothetical protein ACE5FA_14335 [Dehalococcoidia bacterium]